MKRILLLGSGELGKELTISLKRIGCYVIACDSYKNAPAMQVSDKSEVIIIKGCLELNVRFGNYWSWSCRFDSGI